VRTLLEVLLAFAGTGTAVVALTVGVMMRRLRRRNRLVPDRRTAAPLTWRWSPRRAALLHRRLRRSCELIAAVLGDASRPRRRLPLPRRRQEVPGTVLETAGRELLERAVVADARLADIERRGPAWRRLQLPAVAAEVSAIESAALRLVQLDGELRQQSQGIDVTGGPDRAELLLDAFEAALAELRPPAPDLHAPR
jgi:hypothetical protein